MLVTIIFIYVTQIDTNKTKGIAINRNGFKVPNISAPQRIKFEIQYGINAAFKIVISLTGDGLFFKNASMKQKTIVTKAQAKANNPTINPEKKICLPTSSSIALFNNLFCF